MAGWNKVSTLDELKQFLRTVGVFHDGILKEIHWVNRDYVDASLSMLPSRGSDARILVQRQWEDPSAVEMYVEKIWTLEVDTVEFIYVSTASKEAPPDGQNEPRELLVLNLGGSKITFERMLWRDASDWMGVEPRFGAFTIPKWDEE